VYGYYISIILAHFTILLKYLVTVIMPFKYYIFSSHLLSYTADNIPEIAIREVNGEKYRGHISKENCVLACVRKVRETVFEKCAGLHEASMKGGSHPHDNRSPRWWIDFVRGTSGYTGEMRFLITLQTWAS